MVAMGSSLSDGAWGRESAVYRITGMLTVVGGWFLTALTAFTSAFLMAVLIYFGGMVVIFALIILAIFVVFRTHRIHKKRELPAMAKQIQPAKVLVHGRYYRNLLRYSDKDYHPGCQTLLSGHSEFLKGKKEGTCRYPERGQGT